MNEMFENNTFAQKINKTSILKSHKINKML
jgi:hypothetical protein